MKCHIYLLISCFLLVFIPGRALDCRINLYHPHVLNSVMVTCVTGTYSYTDDLGTVYTLTPGDVVFMASENSSLWIRDKKNKWTDFSSLMLKACGDDAVLRIKPVSPVLEGREYHGHFEVNIAFNTIQLINIIDLEQ